MKTLEELSLRVPVMGEDAARRAVGGSGYSPGGYLNPSYCYGGDGSDSWWWVWIEHFYGDTDGHESDDCGGGGGFDGYTEPEACEVGHVTYDESISPEDRAVIEAFVGTMPETLQNQDVRIVIDPEFMDSLPNGTAAAALFLSDGRYGEKGDTIFLRSAEDVSAILEESIHQWQYHNCWKPGATSTNTLSAMEFQVAAVNTIIHYSTDPDGIYDVPRGLDLLAVEMIAWQNEDGILQADVMTIINSISFSEWEKIYSEWNEAGSRGSIDTTYYDWQWVSLLSIFNSQSSINVISNTY